VENHNRISLRTLTLAFSFTKLLGFTFLGFDVRIPDKIIACNQEVHGNHPKHPSPCYVVSIIVYAKVRGVDSHLAAIVVNFSEINIYNLIL